MMYNLSLLLYSCTQSSAAVPRCSNSCDSHVCLMIWNIPPDCLTATHHHLEEAAISGCGSSDWCLPQARRTGVNAIFSFPFLSPNYMTPSGRLDHRPVPLHPFKDFSGKGASGYSRVDHHFLCPQVVFVLVGVCCESAVSFRVTLSFSHFQLSVVAIFSLSSGFPAIFQPVCLPPTQVSSTWVMLISPNWWILLSVFFTVSWGWWTKFTLPSSFFGMFGIWQCVGFFFSFFPFQIEMISVTAWI